MGRILRPGEFHGQTNTSYTIAGSRFTEIWYPGRSTVSRHSHECAFFGMVIEGSYSQTYGRKQRECGPTSFVFHPEDEVHSEIYNDCVTRVFFVEPASHWIEQVRDYSNCLMEPFESSNGAVTQLGLRLYREFRQQDALTPLALEGGLLELLAIAGRHPTGASEKTMPRWMQQTRNLLHDRFATDLSLREISLIVGIHPAHLARTFRQYYRCSISEYIYKLRVEQSCRDLVGTDTPLCEIAIAVGFSDQSHFTVVFKRYTGMTPGQYRRLFATR